MANAFQHIERTSAGHFRLHFYAAVYALLHLVHRLSGSHASTPDETPDHTLESTLKAHRFLRGYMQEIVPHLPADLGWDPMAGWWRQQITDWEADGEEESGQTREQAAERPDPAHGQGPCHLPLLALARQGGLPFDARVALMVAALPDEDSRFGGLFESLQQPLASQRVSMALMTQLLRSPKVAAADAHALYEPLLAAGLLEVENRAAPRSQWLLAMPAAAWSAMRGSRPQTPGCRFMPAQGFVRPEQLILDDELHARVQRLPALMCSGRVRVLVLRGIPGSDLLQIAGALARALGQDVALVQGTPMPPGHRATTTAPALLGPLCVMGHSLPVFEFDLAPGETAELPALALYRGPVVVLLGPEGGLRAEADADQTPVTLNVPPPSPELRRRAWQQALGAHAGPDIDRLAERFVVPAGHLRQLAAMAVSQAGLDLRERVTLADVRSACRLLNRHLLDTHAAHLDGGGRWSDLVVSEGTALRLRDLQMRCRQRERLSARLSPAYGAAATRGVRALLTGSSGTGKTLAARILAAELGMDLYRVDLAAVVDKYIGETEKNLHRVLSRAEALDVVLLLDEGDSLLASRTDVKSSNDRHANLETNYLLQRLETYQGIVLITTNAAQNIDRAFQRRMDVVIPFVHPQTDERCAIWSLHLPADRAVPTEFLAHLAQRCALTGGQIRNAALQATLLAMDDGSRHVDCMHLEAAVHDEYRKAGASCPLGTDAPTAATRGVAAFMDVMRL